MFLALVGLVALGPPAVAPFMSEHPILWVYQIHHPGTYRFPSYVVRVSNAFDAESLTLRGTGSRAEQARRTMMKVTDLWREW